MIILILVFLNEELGIKGPINCLFFKLIVGEHIMNHCYRQPVNKTIRINSCFTVRASHSGYPYIIHTIEKSQLGALLPNFLIEELSSSMPVHTAWVWLWVVLHRTRSNVCTF